MGTSAKHLGAGLSTKAGDGLSAGNVHEDLEAAKIACLRLVLVIDLSSYRIKRGIDYEDEDDHESEKTKKPG